MTRHNKRGQIVAFFGIFCLTFLGLAALVIDSARLYFVARETQAVADASALGGALAYVKGADYVQGATTEAGLNYADGKLFNLGPQYVYKGNWNIANTPPFTKDGTPTNAVLTIPQLTVTNVIGLWSTTSLVKRSAIAAFEPFQGANPQLPLMLGNCFTCEPGNCSPTPIIIDFGNTTQNNAGWWQVDRTGTKSTKDFIPTGCGGNGQTLGTYSVGTTIDINGGSRASVCDDFSCLVGNEYLVPVVGRDCNTPLNQSTEITGFATIRLLGTDCSNKITGTDTGGNNTMEVQPVLNDCNSSQNASSCAGSTLGGSCQNCGTGRVVLAQ